MQPSVHSHPLRILSAALVALLASGLVVTACGGSDDSSSTTAVRASTGSGATTVRGGASSTSSSTSVAGTRNGSIALRVGDRSVALTSESCSNTGPTSLELTATDASGNTLTVDATDGSGSATYRGPSEDLEGTVRSVQVDADGTFSAKGVMSVADHTAPGPSDLNVSGSCS